MRIIGGFLGGRNFASPGTRRTHPMSDKMRGALFSALGDIDGLSVLDLYSGSGALGLEAVSRGAASVLSIETDPQAVKTIAENIRELALSETMAVRLKNVAGWSRNNQDKQYDLVLADPPYTDIRPNVLERLSVHVTLGGLLVLSWPGSEPVREFNGLELVRSKQYGDAQLAFYRRPAAAA